MPLHTILFSTLLPMSSARIADGDIDVWLLNVAEINEAIDPPPSPTVLTSLATRVTWTAPDQDERAPAQGRRDA